MCSTVTLTRLSKSEHANPNRIIDKANGWTGRLFHLSKGVDFAFTGLIAPPTDPSLGRALDRALAILQQAPRVRDVVLERHADRVLETIRRDTDDSSPYGQ